MPTIRARNTCQPVSPRKNIGISVRESLAPLSGRNHGGWPFLVESSPLMGGNGRVQGDNRADRDDGYGNGHGHQLCSRERPFADVTPNIRYRHDPQDDYREDHTEP